MSPEKSFSEEVKEDPELEEQIFHAIDFYEGILLQGIRKGDITEPTALYEALDNYRLATKVNINIAQIFGLAGGRLMEAGDQFTAGQTSFDVLEIYQAAMLVADAIIEDERLFSEPDFHQSGPKRKTDERYRLMAKGMKMAWLQKPIAKSLGQSH